MRPKGRGTNFELGGDLPLNTDQATRSPFHEEVLALAKPDELPAPLDTLPWLRGEEIDGTGKLSNGIRYRLRIMPSGPLCAFVIWDTLNGLWVMKEFGLQEGGAFLDRLEEDWVPGSWWRFGTSGFYGLVPNEYIVVVFSFMRELLTDLNSTSVLGLDSTLEKVVPYSDQGECMLRASITPLEVEQFPIYEEVGAEAPDSG